MSLWDWTDIQALSINYLPVLVRLSSDSLALFLSSESLTEIGSWSVSGQIPTPSEADEIEAMTAQAYYELMANIMIGTIFSFATVLPPQGSLECDGASYLRVDFPSLYDQLDASYIIDADNFAVPDLRGRTVIGVGTGSGLTPRSMNDAGGEETHALTVAETPSHSHSIIDAGHLHTEGTALPSIGAALLGVPIPSAIPSVGVTGVATTGISINNTGGDGAHENMQPFLALRYALWAL